LGTNAESAVQIRFGIFGCLFFNSKPLLQAQGTGPDGEAVTLRLAARYFWMGGHLYLAKIGRNC
jgi:hypothetical protein